MVVARVRVCRVTRICVVCRSRRTDGKTPGPTEKTPSPRYDAGELSAAAAVALSKCLLSRPLPLSCHGMTWGRLKVKTFALSTDQLHVFVTHPTILLPSYWKERALEAVGAFGGGGAPGSQPPGCNRCCESGDKERCLRSRLSPEQESRRMRPSSPESTPLKRVLTDSSWRSRLRSGNKYDRGPRRFVRGR